MLICEFLFLWVSSMWFDLLSRVISLCACVFPRFRLILPNFQHSVWLDDAFDRARQLYLSYYRSIPKSLERSTAHKLMLAMLDGDERFVEPTPKSLQTLTLQTVKDAVMNQFVGNNMEVCLFSHY